MGITGRRPITTPLWVKVAIAVLVAAVLTVIAVLITYGGHEPARGKSVFAGALLAIPLVVAAKYEWTAGATVALAFASYFCVALACVSFLTRERRNSRTAVPSAGPSSRRTRGITRRSAVLGAAFCWALVLVFATWLSEGQASGVLVIHSKGRIAGIYLHSVDPAGFRVAFCVGLAGLAFCSVLAAWCTWRVFRPTAR